MRRGELCALRWKDSRRECIVVSRSRGRVRGAGLLEGPTKNGKPRLIAVSRTMSGVLDALRQWQLDVYKRQYNTCVNAGVDECVIWGDYYFMEALTRLKNPNWEMYW